jgi:hypothetical protein
MAEGNSILEFVQRLDMGRIRTHSGLPLMILVSE